MRRGEDIYTASWRLFCSLRLTVWILALLLVGCIAGMFWDQTLSWRQQVDALQGRPIVLQLLFLFELGDAFHSWWFGALVLLLAINLTACSMQRLPPIWIAIARTPKRLSDSLLQTTTYKCVHRVSLPPAQMIKRVQSVLPKMSCEIHGDTIDGFMHKHRFARLGVYVIHAALLLILFASVLQSSCGVDGMLLLRPEQPVRMLQARGPAGVVYGHDLGFWVRCDHFYLHTFANGSPREFASDLVLWSADGNNTHELQQTVRVGEPLHYRGYTLYQASYQRLPNGDRVRLSVVYHNNPNRQSVSQPALQNIEHEGVVGQPLRLHDGSALVPLQVIDNAEGFGEALQLRHVQQEKGENQKGTANKTKNKTEFTVFRDYPDFDQQHRAADWHVVFHGSQPQYATGISVSKTTLVPVVFAGFVLLFVGLCIAFGMQDRRLYVRAKPLYDGDYEVVLAGFVHHRRAGQFAQEFAKISKRLFRLLHN
ncbi:MAG: cytochrome c biogenesis protein ResB [Myxococcota bacterium]